MKYVIRIPIFDGFLSNYKKKMLSLCLPGKIHSREEPAPSVGFSRPDSLFYVLCYDWFLF